MQIHVGRNNQQLGTFTVPQILGGLASGQFLPTDMAWHEGLADWTPLNSLDVLSEAPPPPPEKRPEPPPAKPAFALPKIERTEAPPSKARQWIIRAAVFLVLLAIGIPLTRFVKEKLVVSRSISNAVSIVEACNRYADQHGGVYPPGLNTLITEKLVSNEKSLSCPLGGDDGGIGYDYFAGGAKKSAAPDRVIVISKVATAAGERVVVTSDGSAKLRMLPLMPKAK